MKPRIRKNEWDNWYGYLGRKRVISFWNSPTETQEQQATRWLKEQLARNAALEAIKDFLEWGAKTSSDRELFDDRFRKILRDAGIPFTEPEY